MTTTLIGHVREYVARIRLELADLPDGDIDELLCGLTADLSEALLDAAVPPPRGTGSAMDLDAVFGSPAAYAAELRRSAGIEGARQPQTRPEPGRIRRAWRAGRRSVASSRSWSAVSGFLSSIRPAWWVLRGLVFALLALALVSGIMRQAWERPAGWLVLAAGVIASVTWGRYRHQGRRPHRWLAGLVNVAGAIAVLGAYGILMTAQSLDENQHLRAQERRLIDAFSATNASMGALGNGVWVEGMQVSNLFVYDAEGNPVPAAQIYDDRGRPVQTVGAPGKETQWAVYGISGDWYYQPSIAAGGWERWNSYPLRAVETSDMVWNEATERLEPTDPSLVQEMPWPFAKAPEVSLNSTDSTPPAGPSGSVQSADGATTD